MLLFYGRYAIIILYCVGMYPNIIPTHCFMRYRALKGVLLY